MKNHMLLKGITCLHCRSTNVLVWPGGSIFDSNMHLRRRFRGFALTVVLSGPGSSWDAQCKDCSYGWVEDKYARDYRAKAILADAIKWYLERLELFCTVCCLGLPAADGICLDCTQELATVPSESPPNLPFSIRVGFLV